MLDYRHLGYVLKGPQLFSALPKWPPNPPLQANEEESLMQSNEFNQFLSGVQDIADTLAPRLWGGGVDLPATLFIERGDGSCCLSPIENQHMSSHEAKHCWFLLYLPAILRAESAKRYAILSEAWSVKPEARAHLDAWWAEGHTSLSEHPARMEVLVLAGFDRQDRIVYENTIKRVGKRRSRRRLTKWRVACEGDDVAGRMALGIDALLKA
jgi:hypothetical protein